MARRSEHNRLTDREWAEIRQVLTDGCITGSPEYLEEEIEPLIQEVKKTGYKKGYHAGYLAGDRRQSRREAQE